MDRAQRIAKIKQILKKHKIKKAYFFGSFARKEKNYKDIDIAILPPCRGFSLLDLIGIEQEMEYKTGKSIDLMTIKSISPYFKPYIKKDMVPV